MYIKKKDKELITAIDENLKEPKGFKDFIKEFERKHKLIIKYKDKNVCTNCDTEFIKKTKIGECCKCPKCKNTYLVKSSKLRKFTFTDSIGLVDKYKDYYIIRHYEVKTWFDNGTYFTHTCEYGRNIYDDRFYHLHEIINDNISSGIGFISINHKCKYNSNWHCFSSYYKSLSDNLIIYPNNLKSLLKGTKWQYSQLWKLAKHTEYFDISYLLRYYTDTIELLIKLGFYNLALCHNTFNVKGNFEARFEVPKEYAPFIKKHNLDVDELEILKYTKEKDIRIIKYFKKMFYYLEDLKKYNINLKELKNRTDISHSNNHEYIDYLMFVKYLELDLKDKSIKYPKHIKEAHDKYEKQYKMQKDKLLSSKIKNRFVELKKYEFEDKKFYIRPARSIKDMQNESKQMNNCVRTYSERVANEECDIYFMRLKEDKEKSLVTVEVRKNKVVQKRTKNNNCTTKEQDKFLDLWERKILNVHL